MGYNRILSMLACVLWLVRLEERAVSDTDVLNLPPCISNSLSPAVCIWEKDLQTLLLLLYCLSPKCGD